MFKVVGSLLGGIVNGVSGYFKSKQELKKVKLESEKKVIEARANAEIAISEAKIQLAKSGQSNDYNLDMMAMENMEKSYKDEFILIVFLAPMIMAFVPGYDTIALAGFKVISQMPEWYRYIIIGMVVVIYGMRGMLKGLINKKLTLGKK
mgnify:CR=1 FL=1